MFVCVYRPVTTIAALSEIVFGIEHTRRRPVAFISTKAARV
jgi:hypothetical protein